MSAKAREYDAAVARVIHDAGARIVERGCDGSGHRTITFAIHNQQRTFHYPSTGASRGHGILNMRQRLRWLIQAIPEPVECEEPTPAPSTPTVADPPPAPVLRVAPPTPPPPGRLNAQQRRELRKRYLSLPTIETLASEAKIDVEKLTQIVLSERGAPADKLRRELNNKRMEEARRVREALKKSAPKAVPKPFAKLTPVQKKRLVHKLYFNEGRPAREVAEMLGISRSTVTRIAQ